MQEEWRPVVGFEGLYEVSNLGRVKGVERVMQYVQMHKGVPKLVNYPVHERIIRQGKRRDGYADVPLSRNGDTENYLVHRLIAEAWIHNSDPLHLTFVNHIDSNRSNNSINNLEWTSPGQNTSHAIQHFKRKGCIPIYCIETNKVYASMSQADRDLSLVPGTAHDTIRHNKRCNYTFRIATAAEIKEWTARADSDNDSLTYRSQPPIATNPTNRQVKCLDTKQVFSSISELARLLDVTTSAIESSIRNHYTCKGYTFYYLDQLDQIDEKSYLLRVRRSSQSSRGVSYWRGRDIYSNMPVI